MLKFWDNATQPAEAGSELKVRNQRNESELAGSNAARCRCPPTSAIPTI